MGTASGAAGAGGRGRIGQGRRSRATARRGKSSCCAWTAVRWYGRFRLSLRDVCDLLAERGVDVSPRTVLSWVHTVGPLLAAELRRKARPLGQCWYIDETYVRVGGTWAFLYRAVDETGQVDQVVDVLLREQRDLASARAFLQQARRRRATRPAMVITDKHAAYGHAIRRHAPRATHVRTGGPECTAPVSRPPNPWNAATHRSRIACGRCADCTPLSPGDRAICARGGRGSAGRPTGRLAPRLLLGHHCGTDSIRRPRPRGGAHLPAYRQGPPPAWPSPGRRWARLTRHAVTPARPSHTARLLHLPSLLPACAPAF